jgi:uncharacterized membrane protein YcjF (UPF0283 family)
MSDDRSNPQRRGDSEPQESTHGIRRGPAQPKRVRWAQTLNEATPIDECTPGSGADDCSGAEHFPEQPPDRAAEHPIQPRDQPRRLHGPDPVRRPHATRDIQAVPVEEPAENEGIADRTSLLRPTILTGAVLAVLALVLLVIALITLTQFLVLYNEIRSLPGWVRPIGYLLLATLAILIVYFGARIALLYIRLRVSPRLSLAADDLQRRDQVHSDIQEQRLFSARSTLTDYLNDYRFTSGKKRQLRILEVDPKALDRLESIRHTLIADRAVSDDQEWIRRYQSEFLGPLDSTAERFTRRMIYRAVVGTAAIPGGTLDTIAVLILSYRLVEGLCTVYNVRAGRWETTVIMTHVMVSLLTASEAEEFGEGVGEQASSLLDASFTTIPSALAGFARPFIGRAAEGGANGLLLWRLGVRTQRYLRPIQRKPRVSRDD